MKHQRTSEFIFLQCSYAVQIVQAVQHNNSSPANPMALKMLSAGVGTYQTLWT